MQITDIRRRPDGSIDTGFYHARARRMRGLAMRQLMARGSMRRLVGTIAVLSLLVVGAAAGALYILTKDRPSPLIGVELTPLEDELASVPARNGVTEP